MARKTIDINEISGKNWSLGIENQLSVCGKVKEHGGSLPSLILKKKIIFGQVTLIDF